MAIPVVHAQETTGIPDPGRPLRVEIAVKSANETYRVIPCGQLGAVIFYRSQEVSGDGKINWYFSGYDTNLVQSWVQPVPLPSGRDFLSSTFCSDTLVMLFSETGKSKFSINSLEIIRIIIPAGVLILNSFPLENGDIAGHFSAGKGRVWAGLISRNETGRILTVDPDRGTVSSFPLGTGDRTGLLWIGADSATATLWAMVTRQVTKKITEYYLVQYDSTGALLRETPIQTGTVSQQFTRATVITSGPGEKLILGSYGLAGKGQGGKGSAGGLATGLFSCLVKNGIAQSVRYFNFLEFKNATSFVGESGILYLKKKALKKNRTLGEYSLDYSMQIHDAVRIGGRYVLLAESYSPQYHTESFTDFDFYGRPYTNSYSVFDGYRFFNAIVAGFDAEGSMVWDNCMEIRNLVSFDLAPKVSLFSSGGNLVLCYSSEGKIGSRVIRESEVIEKQDFADVEMLHSDDKLISESKGVLAYWYGNYFLSQGYQEIRNIALENNSKRMVFCFSKLRFDP